MSYAATNHRSISKAAIARVLGVAAGRVQRVEVWANVAFAVVKGLGARFVSYAVLAADFRAIREAAAAQVELVPMPYGYRAIGRDAIYSVTPNRCTCPDWESQNGQPGQTCKHVIALIGLGGFALAA